MKYIVSLLLISTLLISCASQERMARSFPNQALAHQQAAEGLQFLQKGYTDYALEKLRAAQAESPNDPEVLGSLGYFYEKMGETSKANGYFLEAIAKNPQSSLARKQYQAFLLRNGYRQESRWYAK